MFKNIAGRYNATGNVGTEFCDGAIFKITGDSIFDGVNFFDSLLDF
ncbi:hypothetical protein [Chryseobacterium sp. MP_3.2]|nr:hypothetical protein [Chryseobacterium sp. MP_3.2]